MAAFASIDELQDLLELDSINAARATLLLNLATALIRREVGQQISLVEDDTVTLAADSTGVVLLPELPVRDVTVVAVDDAASTAWSVTSAGVLAGVPGSAVTVTYSHGYETVPDDIKAICLQAAARAYGNPGGDRSESVGNWSVTHTIPSTGEALGVLLNEHEKRALDPYRP